QYNAAVAEKRALEADLAALQSDTGLSRAEIETMVDQVGLIVDALNGAGSEELAAIYQALDLSMNYHHEERVIDIKIEVPHVVKFRVRGGT
nr:hypothetical protein [Longispora sp. (in: high G+C Gram-positive bacteria)]